MNNRDRFKRGKVANGSRGAARAAAFSLVELLTVIFIISLLIGILIPSINGARTAAKKATTAKAMDAIKVGLEMFKNDNGGDFRQTNGYPPSFAHPKIPGYQFEPHKGQFPFLPSDTDTRPVVNGAHWLPAMLMGVDHLGYIKRSSVPTKNDLHKQPWRWYTADPLGEGKPLSDRAALYLDPGNVATRPARNLPGRPPEALDEFFPNWDEQNLKGMSSLPVIVDSFDQPVLYYAASTHAQVTNMVADERVENNEYTGGPQQEGIPFYFHQDNAGFTGTKDKLGWDFGGRSRHGAKGERLLHAIADPGGDNADLTADKLILPEERDTFARYVIDRKIFQSFGLTPPSTTPLRPVNADTYLLISAGPDGLYGTEDDVNNLPPWPD